MFCRSDEHSRAPCAFCGKIGFRRDRHIRTIHSHTSQDQFEYAINISHRLGKIFKNNFIPTEPKKCDKINKITSIVNRKQNFKSCSSSIVTTIFTS